MAHVRGKRSAPIGVALLLLLACSSDSSTTTSSPSVPAEQQGASTTTIVIGSDGSSTVLTDSSDVVAPPGEVPTSAPDNGSVTQLDATGPPGSFAPGLLSPARSSAVDVEVRAQSSAEPRQQSIDHVVSVLGNVSGKPVRSVAAGSISGSARSWTADDLKAVADESRAVQQGGGHAAIHLLFVHGTMGGDNSVLGVAVRGDTAAIFVDRINASATPIVGSSGIETSVVTHEVGHLLGLVDLYLHTGRQDAEHPGHSTDQNSVMYWAVESDLVADLLQGGPPREFDDADLADLKTIRDGG